MSKQYSDTYIFKQYAEYEKKLYTFVMGAERINASGDEFEDVLYDIKQRRISNKLAKLATSKNVVLAINNEPLPRAFKTFVFKDTKDNNKPKVFIDCTDLVKFVNGSYVCRNSDHLVSYLIAGVTEFVYILKEHALTGKAEIVKDGGDCFVRMFSYIIDYLYKTSSVQSLRKKIEYMASMYYQISLVGRDIDSSGTNIKSVAAKMADISIQDAAHVDAYIKPEDFKDLSTFLNAMSKILNLKQLSVGPFINTWADKFDTGTLFAPEYLPAFCTLLTNVYVGGYTNPKQQIIEKLCGLSMTNAAKAILQVGDSVIS